MINRNQNVQPNFYAIFIEPPSTGKSQALKLAGKCPLQELKTSRKLEYSLLEKTTSAGLRKRLSDGNGAIIISPEVSEVLMQLIKGDKDNHTDTSLLCELFSGESSWMTLATTQQREILDYQMLPMV